MRLTNQPTLGSRVLLALKREGGEASAQLLGRLTGKGTRVNSALNHLLAQGLVKRTDRKVGRSIVWALAEGA